jgi:hypothetical protein
MKECKYNIMNWIDKLYESEFLDMIEENISHFIMRSGKNDSPRYVQSGNNRNIIDRMF